MKRWVSSLPFRLLSTYCPCPQFLKHGGDFVYCCFHMAEQHGGWLNPEGSFYGDKTLFRVRTQDETDVCLESPEKKGDEFQPLSPGPRVLSSCCLPGLPVTTTCSSSNEPTQGSRTVSRRHFKQADDWVEDARH